MNYRIVYTIIVLLIMSSEAYAGTICVGSCPAEPGPDEGPILPAISEITSSGNSVLDIQNDGLILLDTYIYDNLTIDIAASTTIYFGLGALPPGLEIPGDFILNVLGLGNGGSILGSIAADHLLLRQFDNTDQLTLSASQGVVVFDTATLIATPIPAAMWLFGSGLVMLMLSARRKI